MATHAEMWTGQVTNFARPEANRHKFIAASASCYACHERHGAVDTTFVQFYPTLIATARAKHTLSTTYVREDRTGVAGSGR